MILEGVVTTTNPDNTINVAPMGPVVDAALLFFELQPFDDSTTYQNLVRTRCGALHVTDDVLLIARAVTDALPDSLETSTCSKIAGRYLNNACRVYEFQVDLIDDSQPRAIVKCRTVNKLFLREFFGFNRGKHAVLEAAILATRVNFLPLAEIQHQFDRLRKIVEKTGGRHERDAFQLLEEYIGQPGDAGRPGAKSPT